MSGNRCPVIPLVVAGLKDAEGLYLVAVLGIVSDQGTLPKAVGIRLLQVEHGLRGIDQEIGTAVLVGLNGAVVAIHISGYGRCRRNEGTGFIELSEHVTRPGIDVVPPVVHGICYGDYFPGDRERTSAIDRVHQQFCRFFPFRQVGVRLSLFFRFFMRSQVFADPLPGILLAEGDLLRQSFRSRVVAAIENLYLRVMQV